MDSSANLNQAQRQAHRLLRQRILTCRRLLFGSVAVSFFLGVLLCIQSLSHFSEQRSAGTLLMGTAVALLLSVVVVYNVYDALRSNLQAYQILRGNQPN